MTALPTWTSVPLTAAEYAALPEMEGRYELQEGAIVVAGSPVPDHQNGVLELAFQLREQTPSSEASFSGSATEVGCSGPPTCCSPSRSSPAPPAAPTQ
jgi:Uma2 family endonuclease